MVCHRTNAGVGPYIFGCFHHIYNSINRSDDTKDGDRGTDARHQRERQEEAAHGDASIADGGNDGYQNPYDDGSEVEDFATILHHEERGDEDEGGATVHVDGGADGEHEAGDVFADTQAILG